MHPQSACGALNGTLAYPVDADSARKFGVIRCNAPFGGVRGGGRPGAGIWVDVATK